MLRSLSYGASAGRCKHRESARGESDILIPIRDRDREPCQLQPVRDLVFIEDSDVMDLFGAPVDAVDVAEGLDLSFNPCRSAIFSCVLGSSFVTAIVNVVR